MPVSFTVKKFLLRYVATLFIGILMGVLLFNSRGLDLYGRIIFLTVIDFPLVFITFYFQDILNSIEFTEKETVEKPPVIKKFEPKQIYTITTKPNYSPVVGDLVRIIKLPSNTFPLDVGELCIVLDTSLYFDDKGVACDYIGISSVFGFSQEHLSTENVVLVEKAREGRNDYATSLDFILYYKTNLEGAKTKFYIKD